MYAHCLFCHAHLGRNEAIEAFPVGRRLAYDADKGRLWVVCGSCRRWNLTPLEERWEAIEQAERSYRTTRLRASTDNVGLARAADGTDLVRVGRPILPEFAGWRYGSRLVDRRRRYLVRAAPATALGFAGAAVGVCGYLYLPTLAGPLGVVGGVMAFAAVDGARRFVHHAEQATRHAMTGSAATVAARLWASVGDGSRVPLVVRRGHLAESTMFVGADGALALDVRYESGRADLRGADARRAALLLSCALNADGGTTGLVDEAVRSIDVRGGPERYLAVAGRWLGKSTRPLAQPPAEWTRESNVPQEGLYALTPTQRLALEIVLHEEAERRALDGELAELDRAWRDAEEIAAIADNLALPRDVEDAWGRLRRRVRP
ncbi:hypothetical protein tb265_28310 [Gemmatimonadetes bacterium T265]|nr:hypothetical protein tb265_28310 [Gemmatimonadetes bacterium T265]